MPGEDCAVAHLWAPNFNWYDVPCKLRGFPIDEKRGGVTFNPLCEHEPGQEEPYSFMEGLDQVNVARRIFSLERLIIRLISGLGFNWQRKLQIREDAIWSDQGRG